ncbi:MAG TPA: molybdopterin cofactor-binding domain-containing protein, partial [Tepidisphaeraceae bacterium]|nr:molybdopterin cofactor-binding domain-containing protein [Tepidisphaeraceae bacterium]
MQTPQPNDALLSRRDFVQILGTGLLIAATGVPAFSQNRGQNNRDIALDTRLHVGKDGIITVMTGKVECGQGARAEITQAAAEELGVHPDQIQLIMADTELVPDDGITAGSRTTPSTLPPIRQACATARRLLLEIASLKLDVPFNELKFENGAAVHSKDRFTYADLAAASEAVDAFKQNIPHNVTLASVTQWKVLGTSLPRPNRGEIVVGKHQYPSDIVRPGMLY